MSNSTAVGWTPEPDGRGTFGIIKTCVLTLALCVYTALHLNIPHPDASQANKCWTKTQWVLMGVFAPEYIVYVAWTQNRRANQLSKDLEAIFGRLKEEDPQNRRRYKWTKTHSFYVIMGGFAVDTDIDGQQFIPGYSQLALEDELVKGVAELGLLPDISKEYIKDKSKADSVAKGLVLVQASWLIFQVITRWASGLFVTALELNALAHAICALLVYFLWWEKPLDIQNATKVPGDLVLSIAALCWECALGRSNPIYLGVPSTGHVEKWKEEEMLKYMGYSPKPGARMRTAEEYQEGGQQQSTLEAIFSSPDVWVGYLGHFPPASSAIPLLELRGGHIERKAFFVTRMDDRCHSGWNTQSHPFTKMLGAPCLPKESEDEADLEHASSQSIILRRWELILHLQLEYPQVMESFGVAMKYWTLPVMDSTGNEQPRKKSIIGLSAVGKGMSYPMITPAAANSAESGTSLPSTMAFVV
ncbi:hypothetical protein AB5N19_09899 [Seiridium cardinale]